MPNCQTHKQTLRAMALIVGLTLFVIPAASADIYVYIDHEGTLHFTNTPTSSQYKVYLRETFSKPTTSHHVASYDDVISEAAKRHGLSSSLIKALIHVESFFNPMAVS
jgi:soluble lytic murein transglycosylase